MSSRDRDKTTDELASLYNRHRDDDIEPEAGLDRLIRARAEAATEAPRSNRSLPWVGGLATASLAIVALAVVLQQTPTDERHETDIATDALSRPAPASDEPSPKAASNRQARVVDRKRSGSGEQRFKSAERSLPESGAAAVEETTEAVRAEAPAADADDPERWIAIIRALIDRGEIETARRQVDQLRKTNPEFQLPEDIGALLDPNEAGRPSDRDSSDSDGGSRSR
jgi:hypothetical protein